MAQVEVLQGAEQLSAGLPELLARLGACALAAEGFAGARVEVTITDDEAMRALNRRFRGVDKPTDVLSFPLWSPQELQRYREGGLPPGQPPGAPLTLGDVVINLAEAGRAAQRYGHSLERELGFLLVHGILHLLGYDHGTPEEEARMQARTEAVLSRFGLRRDAGPERGGCVPSRAAGGPRQAPGDAAAGEGGEAP